MERTIIETIYKILIDNLPITNKTMEQYGLTQGDIDELLKDNEIMPKKDNTYSLVRVDNLRKYGVHLLEEKKAYEANLCFKKCYELLPNSKKVVFQLILAKIIKQNYEEAFEIYLNFEKMQIVTNKKENDLYIWLFSYIVDYPTESYERVINIKPEDLLLPYNQTNYMNNKIRLSISMHKFKYAHKLIVEEMRRGNDISAKTEVLRRLVNKSIDIEKHTKIKLLELTKKEEYKEIVFTLSQIQNRRRLSKLEKGILTTAKAIYDLLTYHKLPTPMPGYIKDMYDAIEVHEFKFALELNQEFLNYIKTEEEDNLISILLTKINTLIDEIEQNEKEENQSTQKDEELKENITNIEKLESLASFISNRGETLEEVRKYKKLYQDSETKIKRLKKF